MPGRLLNRNFAIRILSGAVLLAVVAGAVIWSAWSFGALMILVGAGCLREFYSIAEKAGAKPQKIYGTTLGLAVLTVSFVSLSIPAAVPLWPVLPLLSGILIVELYRKSPTPLHNAAVTLLGLLYITVPVILFFLMAFPYGAAGYDYRKIILYFLIIWANDTGAYLFGMTVGRRRLFERISPKKSWEGFFGGIASGLAVAFAGSSLMGFGPRACVLWTGLGLVVSIAGVLGDLVESMFKRSVSLKDSGSVIPGHGGLLDRFDAMLFSIPFAFAYYRIFGL